MESPGVSEYEEHSLTYEILLLGVLGFKTLVLVLCSPVWWPLDLRGHWKHELCSRHRVYTAFHRYSTLIVNTFFKKKFVLVT